jgi:hypothetical protein
MKRRDERGNAQGAATGNTRTGALVRESLKQGIPEFQYLVQLLPRDAMEVTECGTRCTSFRPQVADSLERRGAQS